MNPEWKLEDMQRVFGKHNTIMYKLLLAHWRDEASKRLLDDPYTFQDGAGI